LRKKVFDQGEKLGPGAKKAMGGGGKKVGFGTKKPVVGESNGKADGGKKRLSRDLPEGASDGGNLREKETKKGN